MQCVGPSGGGVTYNGPRYSFNSGSNWASTANAALSFEFCDTPPVVSTGADHDPQVGMISMSVGQTQPVYESAGGGVVRDAAGNELLLPQDYDGNGFDTHLVMSTVEVDGKVIVAQEGSIDGDLVATNADIAGSVEGQINIHGRLTV